MPPEKPAPGTMEDAATSASFREEDETNAAGSSSAPAAAPRRCQSWPSGAGRRGHRAATATILPPWRRRRPHLGPAGRSTPPLTPPWAGTSPEWRMDEYGEDHGHDDDAGPTIDMVVCKVYPARGGALHDSLRLRLRALAAERDVKPQVLVQLHLASRSARGSLRCRVHRAADVFASHPAILTNVIPAANDRFEWFFAVRRPRDAHDDDGMARAWRAGPGEYVPVGNDRCIRDGRGREVGYQRVFRYREDDETVRHVSRTAWWMEEYGFRPHFPYGERGGEEVVVYKVYLRMAHQ